MEQVYIFYITFKNGNKGVFQTYAEDSHDARLEYNEHYGKLKNNIENVVCATEEDLIVFEVCTEFNCGRITTTHITTINEDFMWWIYNKTHRKKENVVNYWIDDSWGL